MESVNDNIEIWNGFALIKDDTHFTKWVKEHKSLCTDPYHLELVKQYIPKGGVVIDGGANIGTFTNSYCDLVGQSGRVYAFEPNMVAFICLSKNAPLAEKHFAALGSTNGYCTVQDKDKNHGAAYCEQGGTVAVKTIDSLELDRLDFVKLDIEGWELDALRGAAETIKRCRPVLDIEINDATLERNGLTDRDLYEYVESIGYSIAHRIGQKPQVDIICVPK